MADKMDTVVATFDTRREADDAVERLVRDGFDRASISVLMSEAARTKHYGANWAGKDTAARTDPQPARSMEGAGAGAALGGTLGAIVAGLAAVGTIALPGIGLLAAGPIVAALAGAGAGGAAGGLVGGLVGLGVGEAEAKSIESRLKAGGIIVACHTINSRVARAKELLRREGGEDVARV